MHQRDIPTTCTRSRPEERRCCPQTNISLISPHAEAAWKQVCTGASDTHCCGRKIPELAVAVICKHPSQSHNTGLWWNSAVWWHRSHTVPLSSEQCSNNRDSNYCGWISITCYVSNQLSGSWCISTRVDVNNGEKESKRAKMRRTPAGCTEHWVQRQHAKRNAD